MDLDILTKRNVEAAKHIFTDMDIPYLQPIWPAASQNRAPYEIQFPFMARFSPNDIWAIETRQRSLNKWHAAMRTFDTYDKLTNVALFKYGIYNSLREESLRLIMWVGFAKTIQVAFPFPDIRPLDAIRFCFVNNNDIGNDITYSRSADTLRIMSYHDIVKANFGDKVSGRLATGSHMNILQHVWNGGYFTSFTTSIQFPLLQQTNHAIQNLLKLYVDISTDIRANDVYVVDKYHYQITPPPCAMETDVSVKIRTITGILKKWLGYFDGLYPFLMTVATVLPFIPTTQEAAEYSQAFLAHWTKLADAHTFPEIVKAAAELASFYQTYHEYLLNTNGSYEEMKAIKNMVLPDFLAHLLIKPYQDFTAMTLLTYTHSFTLAWQIQTSIYITDTSSTPREISRWINYCRLKKQPGFGLVKLETYLNILKQTFHSNCNYNDIVQFDRNIDMKYVKTRLTLQHDTI